MKNLWMAAVVGLGLTVNVVRGNPVTIVNGDFSDPIVGGNFSTLNGPNPGGDTSFLPGWTVYGSIDHIGNYWNGPTPGAQSLDMNGYYYAGTISQTVHLSSGSVATVDFYLAGNPDGGPATKTLGVSLTGEVSGSPSIYVQCGKRDRYQR